MMHKSSKNATCIDLPYNFLFMLSCRENAQQSYDCLGVVTPPTPLRQNSVTRPPSSNTRHTDDEGSLRRRAVKVLMLQKQKRFSHVQLLLCCRNLYFNCCECLQYCSIKYNTKKKGFLFQPPIGFSPKNRGGRDLSCHRSFGSLPREGRDQTPPRAEGSPIHGYSSIEISNV